MSTHRICCLCFAGLALSGCVVPAPSVDQRSPAVSGRLLDASTKQPVQGAVVMLHEHPSYKARTDSDGIYRIRARHNVHLLSVLGICGGQIPEGNYYRADELDISHPFYEVTRIEAARYLDAPPTNDAPVVLRDVALKRISPECAGEECDQERQHTDPADNAYITVTINGKRVDLGQGVGPEMIRRSVDLVASCAYMSQKMRWDEIVEEPRAIGGEAKLSYLRAVFENPRAIKVQQVTLQARAIVITLPLVKGGIWVHTDKGTVYLAKFDHTVTERLQTLLDQRP